MKSKERRSLSSDVRSIAEVVGAIQDTLRVNAEKVRVQSDQFYVQIISLDLVFMDLVSMLPEEERKNILQNQFDESLSGAENDLKGLLRMREYLNLRIRSCKKFIAERQSTFKQESEQT